MVKKKARLGRGLGALLGEVKATTLVDRGDSESSQDAAKTRPESGRGDINTMGYREIPIEQLQRGKYQPRVHMDRTALAELGESIKSQGVLQPLLVRPVTTDTNSARYEIIAGERRWRGAQLAGLMTVPAVVREITDQTAMAVGLIENIQRENLNAIEQARGFKRLLEEFGLTHQQVSEVVGCSRAAVSNLLRMLTLHPRVQKMVEKEQIDMGHARALLALPENMQPESANKVSNRDLSVRQTEQLVKSLLKSRNKNPDAEQNKQGNADILHLQDDISARLGAKVDIQHGVKKGKLIIHYHSLDELDGILERIK
jgi:ParB family chromosome partitioning protein